MELTITLTAGLISGILMFCGDMLLYYDQNDYVSDGTFNPIIGIMKNISTKRLYAGGLLGPIAAFLYCVGYYHIVLIFDNEIFILAMVCFLILCMAIIIGGAYHSHCAYLGLIGKLDDEKAMDVIIKYFSFINKVCFIFQIIGLLMLFLSIILGWTVLPRYFAVITPGILYLLLPLTKKLPKGIHIIICGGWSNLIFIIYYVVLLIYNLVK